METRVAVGHLLAKELRVHEYHGQIRQWLARLSARLSGRPLGFRLRRPVCPVASSIMMLKARLSLAARAGNWTGN